MVKIRQIKKKDINEEFIKSLNSLMKQLTKNAKSLSEIDIKRILDGDFISFGAFDEEKIVGTASIHFVEIYVCKKAMIDDVFVDKDYRHQGIGKKLMKVLLKEAKKRKVRSVYLTSGSSSERKGANILYQKLGFKKLNTNLFGLHLVDLKNKKFSVM